MKLCLSCATTARLANRQPCGADAASASSRRGSSGGWAAAAPAAPAAPPPLARRGAGAVREAGGGAGGCAGGGAATGGGARILVGAVCAAPAWAGGAAARRRAHRRRARPRAAAAKTARAAEAVAYETGAQSDTETELPAAEDLEEESEEEEEAGPPSGSTAPRSPAADMQSPFDQDGVAGGSKDKLPLTWENVQTVLDELRPYLQNDGGDCKIVEIDGPIVRLELQGSCSSCSASSVTLKMGIERTLAQRIPEIAEVVAVMPDEEPLSQEGIEEVLDGIRPFLSVSGGSIELEELVEESPPRIVLAMCGPPLKSMAVRVEVVNRMKRKFPQVQDVDIVPGEEDGAPRSA